MKQLVNSEPALELPVETLPVPEPSNGINWPLILLCLAIMALIAAAIWYVMSRNKESK